MCKIHILFVYRGLNVEGMYLLLCSIALRTLPRSALDYKYKTKATSHQGNTECPNTKTKHLKLNHFKVTQSVPTPKTKHLKLNSLWFTLIYFSLWFTLIYFSLNKWRQFLSNHPWIHSLNQLVLSNKRRNFSLKETTQASTGFKSQPVITVLSNLSNKQYYPM